MSITPSLRASARSAYRNLLRASSDTFSGDANVLQAFREKMRTDALAYKDITNPEEYEQSVKLSNEIAQILRKNIVQGRRVEGSEDTWKLRITRDTELGSNETIKNPPPISSFKKGSAAGPNAALLNHDPSEQGLPMKGCLEGDTTLKKRLNYSALKRAHQQRKIPELREEDLEESFVRGSGPGGQSVNKTENNVQLLHKPTGIRVSCQETRSLSQNRKIARKWLLEKLDHLVNPGLSKEDMKRAKERERERRRRKKAQKKAQKKAEEDGLELGD
ncbi:hypothetical protein AX16_004226 [Volvariella volvacea WC 439]|nr:hypothetical protein AX16_004226 [Volvariella volvacea WC 439]